MNIDAANLIQCPLFRGLEPEDLPGLLHRLRPGAGR